MAAEGKKPGFALAGKMRKPQNRRGADDAAAKGIMGLFFPDEAIRLRSERSPRRRAVLPLPNPPLINPQEKSVNPQNKGSISPYTEGCFVMSSTKSKKNGGISCHGTTFSESQSHAADDCVSVGRRPCLFMWDKGFRRRGRIG
jgi:hypothetical protein